MSDFEQPMPTHRLVETHYGDTLQDVAAREIGNANRWVELIWLNRLVPPYIVDDPRRVAPGVLLSGSMIRVPSPVGLWKNDDQGQVYERDCLMKSRRLVVDAGGDFKVAAGADNLRQQLSHRVVTPRGQAVRHPDYGCMIWRLIGRVNGATAAKMGAEYVRAALQADYRVSSVTSSSAEVLLGSIRIRAGVVAIEGGVVDVEVGQ